MKAVVKFFVFVLALNLVNSISQGSDKGFPVVYKEVGVPSSVNFETVIYTIDPVKLGDALSNALEGALNHQDDLFKPVQSSSPASNPDDEKPAEVGTTEKPADEASKGTEKPTEGCKKCEDELKPYKIQGFIEIIELDLDSFLRRFLQDPDKNTRERLPVS